MIDKWKKLLSSQKRGTERVIRCVSWVGYFSFFLMKKKGKRFSQIEHVIALSVPILETVFLN